MPYLIYDTPVEAPKRLGLKFESQLVIDSASMIASAAVVRVVEGPNGEKIPEGAPITAQVQLTPEDLMVVATMLITRAKEQGVLEGPAHLET